MKKLTVAMIGLLLSGAALASGSYQEPTPADVQAWHAQQAQIKANYAKLPQAEQERIQQQNAAWAARSLRENYAGH